MSTRLLGALAFGLALACLLWGVSQAAGEAVQRGNLRVSYSGTLTPTTLPRERTVPVEVTVGGKITSVDGSTLPELRSFEVAINSHGRLDTAGLPPCPEASIQPASSVDALAACRGSLVGEGSFTAAVEIPEQSPFPSEGEVLAFVGRVHGRPVIFAHVYGTDPLPTSFTLTMSITHTTGTYATVLRGTLPDLDSKIAYVTQISLHLGRTFSHGGERRGFLEASCPAPQGFPGAVFPLLRTAFRFADGRNLGSVLNRSCKARG